MQKTRVLSCFPGTGKTTFFKSAQGQMKISDSDSSNFSWIRDEEGNKVRNPEFVKMYMEHIKRLITEEYSIVLVSTHKEVIQGLISSGIDFVILKPDTSLKNDYLERYKGRGSDEAFINLMDSNWDNFLNDLVVPNVPTLTLQSNMIGVGDIVSSI